MKLKIVKGGNDNLSHEHKEERQVHGPANKQYLITMFFLCIKCQHGQESYKHTYSIKLVKRSRITARGE